MNIQHKTLLLIWKKKNKSKTFVCTCLQVIVGHKWKDFFLHFLDWMNSSVNFNSYATLNISKYWRTYSIPQKIGKTNKKIGLWKKYSIAATSIKYLFDARLQEELKKVEWTDRCELFRLKFLFSNYHKSFMFCVRIFYTSVIAIVKWRVVGRNE